MGLGSFRWRILLIVISALLLWKSSNVWLSFAPENFGTKEQLQENGAVTRKDDQAKQKVQVTVYYEALCPDSRSFFVKQLLPTYQRIPENVQVKFIPYGKATTVKTEHGYEFVCQHGPIECQANIIHACSIDVIKNSTAQLEYLSCMIKNNIDPINIMESCANKMNIDNDSILKCYSETKGKDLLAKYGEMTNDVTPRISFIPTVTLDGNLQNQARILKNLLHEVCLLLKVLPEGCTL